MGSLFSCFKKDRNLDTTLLITGRHCYQCNMTFATRVEYHNHAPDCKRGDL